MSTVGERIKTVRVLSWLTQDEFAKRIGVSRRQVVYWEGNSDLPSADKLPRLCEVLKIPIDWLLTGKGWLRDVVSPAQYTENKRRFLKGSDLLKASLRLRLFYELPLGPIPPEPPTQGTFVDGLPADLHSFVFRVGSDLEPVYTAGDFLYFRILNLAYPQPRESSASVAGTLNGRQVALVLNGRPQLSTFEVETHGQDGFSTFLTPIGAKYAKSRHIVQPDDSILLQGLVYKYVRQM
jgi:transcriptional regulator with XRE-family HTH domain